VATCTIYGLVDPRDGQLRYVGQTVRPIIVRYKQHLVKAKTNRAHRDCWITSLLNLGLKPNWVVFQELDSKDILDQAEIFWIAYFRAMGCKLTNCNDGGRSNSGWTPSAETRAKMSLASKGKKKSATTRAKMSLAQLGNKKGGLRKNFKLSEETKQKIGATNRIKQNRRFEDPREREASRIRTQAMWADPEFRAKMQTICASPEHRAKISVAAKERFSDPQERARVSEAKKKLAENPEYLAKMNATWADPDLRTAHSAILKAAFSNPEHHARQSAAMKAAWARRKQRQST